MINVQRFVAVSDAPLARAARRLYFVARSGVHVPLPHSVARLALWAFLAGRSLYYLLVRVLVCEPLFKGYCMRYGKRLRTGVFVHWVEGSGDIVVGDDVVVDGKCSFTFAARFTSRPMLALGDRTIIGHNCSFTVGKHVTIGRDCRIANDVWIFDSSGHPTEPNARRAGAPPPADEVRPVTIGDNVWIGRGAAICPGVSVGNDSVISAHAVVMSDVPPAVVVGGNPARKVLALGKER
jgi:acetyltransferase-like isoleucine patch superfamily enzyme